MKLTWPALKAALTPHTVDTPRGTLAGYLVRCTASGKELGYVWSAGSSWRWRTPDQHYGERSSQREAVRVLREAHDLRADGLPFDAPKAPVTKPLPTTVPPMKPRAKPLVDDAPTPPRRKAIPLPASFEELPTAELPRIQWGDVPTGVTEALEQAFKRRG